MNIKLNRFPNFSAEDLFSFKIFSGFDRKLIDALCEGGTLIVSKHRETLFDFQEPALHFGIVLGGAYKLSKPTPQGEDVIVHFSTTGDVIGALLMTQAEPLYPVCARAMGPSQFLKIPQTTYMKHWHSQSELLSRIQKLLFDRMSAMQNLKSLQRAPLHARMAALLLQLSDKHPTQADALTIPIPLTRKEIADTLGATVESVIRVMSDWSKKGLLSTNNQLITLLRTDLIAEQINDYQ